MQTIDELVDGQGNPPLDEEVGPDEDARWQEDWKDDEISFPNLSFPPGPDFIQLDWGPLPTKQEYRYAHSLWSRPNSMLDAPENAPYPETRTAVTEFLTKNVYAHLEARGFDLPPTEDEWDPQAQFRFDNGGPALWTYEELGPDLERQAPERKKLEVHDMLISGRGNKYHLWNVPLLRDELKARDLSDRANNEKWLKQRMIDELFAYEHGQQVQHDQHDARDGLCLRQSLDRWGIERRAQDIAACQDREGRLSPLHLYTWALHLSPYNPTYWISRAYLFYQQGYFDLAIGDTFRALYLVKMLIDESERSITTGLYIRVWDAIEQHILASWEADAQDDSSNVIVELKSPNGLTNFAAHLERTSYHILSLSLIGLQAWSDWANIERSVMWKIKYESGYAEPFAQRWRNLRDLAYLRHDSRVNRNERWKHESTAGVVCGRPFPQSAGDVRRTTEAFRTRLNAKFLAWQPIGENDARNAEVREKGNGELGVFSLRAFQPGEIIYTETPSARGILKGLGHFKARRHRQPLPCENCKRLVLIDARYIDATERPYNEEELRYAAAQGHNSICNCVAREPDLHWCHQCGLPDIDKAHHENEKTASASPPRAPRRKAPVNKKTTLAKRRNTRAASRGVPALGGTKKNLTKQSHKSPSPEPSRLPESAANREIHPIKTCLERAREQYHFQSCGVDWSWLHRGMQPKKPDFYVDDEDGSQPEEVNFEEHGTVLSLLLREIFDMTLLKRSNEFDHHMLAHEIDAMLPLCGAENMPARYFPFGYSANIVVPFNILLKLGVDIFKNFDFDTWVIQTVLRKLLMNCVPWDQELRGGSRIQPPTKPSNLDGQAPATFEDLYLHTGFAMFNHACAPSANAEWCWEQLTAAPGQNIHETPTRIIVSARHTIAPDEEIKIQYYPGASSEEQIRLFGRQCDCGQCIPPESSSQTVV